MKLICTFLNFSFLDVYKVTNLMPLIKTPECSKLKKFEKMWVACCHFQELFCFTDANAPLLSLSCAIISISMGKVAWSSLWPYLLNRDPAWHDEKFVLNGLRPSSMASGDVFIWSMPTQREDQQWEEVTQRCLIALDTVGLSVCFHSTFLLSGAPASANQIPDFVMCLIRKSSHCVGAWAQ